MSDQNTIAPKATLKQEVRERTVGYVVAAFGFVAGLAWNDAVQALIREIFPVSAGSLIAKFGYAIGVTIVVVLVTVYLSRLLKQRL